ncbi:unnamed protein product [Gemmata massiliana]|uniref:PEP-CTERM protein-sorting domain-containing protein n=1 Tax=Gemmata massiliana TaxID=1210884 RepID=A0A6P2CZL0_9BACT|nr:hypothetical protein [Gemmata massiliana]VTR93565.1 unnamed protein product [Gemmata massiliana]
MRFSTQAMAVLALVVGGASSAQAGFTVYTSQSAFEAAISGLTKQDFSAAQVADGSAALITGPLTNTSNNGVFKPGDIAPGLSIDSTGSSTLGNMLYIPGVGTVDNDVKGVYTNGSNATLGLTFSPQVDAVGLTLLSFTNNTGPRTFTLSLLGSFSSTPVDYSTGPLPTSGTGTFLGFIGTGGEQIQKISFQPSIRANVGVTSVEFGNQSVVSTPAPPGMVVALTGAGPLAMGVFLRRRRA